MTDPITLLIVDDEPNNLRALSIDLEDKDYKILTAKDGAEAWETLQKHPKEIKTILLDRMMPNMNGMEFLAKIKSDAVLSGIPVIMQTAAAEKEQVVEGIKAGAYYYLTKPYDKDIMLSIVDAAVKDYGNYSQLRKDLQKYTRKLNLIKEAHFEAQTLDDVKYLSSFLSQFFPNPDNVVFGISELLTNAIEHGNLGITYDEKTDLNTKGLWQLEIEKRIAMPEYASKRALISYLRENGEIRLIIKDEGKGFNWQNYIEISPERATHNHGRGIAMSKLISFNSIEYIGCGNEVICKITI